MLNPLVYPGVVVPPPEFNEYAEPPSQTAARHAEKWANNVDPVHGMTDHSGCLHDLLPLPQQRSAVHCWQLCGLCRSQSFPAAATEAALHRCRKRRAAPVPSVKMCTVRCIGQARHNDVLIASQDAAPAAAKGAPRAEGVDAELDAARMAWLPDGTALLMLRSGQMLLASLHAEGGVVHRIQAR